MKLKDHRFKYIWGLIDCHSNGNSIEFRPSLSLSCSLLRSERKFSTHNSGFLFKLNCYRMPFLWHKCFRCALFVFFYQLNFSPSIWNLHLFEICLFCTLFYPSSFILCHINTQFFDFFLWLVFFSLFLNKVTQKSRMLMKKKSTQEQT